MADADDYEEDAERIDREYIPDGATTRAEVAAALEDEGFPDAAQSDIQQWLTTEEDVWDMVGEGGSTKVVDEGSIRSALDADSGVASGGRADSIAEDVGGAIQDARKDALDNLASDGTVRDNGQFFANSINDIEEETRSDGIYYTNKNTGKTMKAAGYDR